MATAKTVTTRIELNLRYVVPERQNFRKNDLTLFSELKKADPKRFVRFGVGDAVLIVSRTGRHLSFIFGEKVDEAGHVFLTSLRMVMTHGTWDARMIVNYAEQVGVVLANRKRFEDFFLMDRERRAEVRQEQTERPAA